MAPRRLGAALVTAGLIVSALLPALRSGLPDSSQAAKPRPTLASVRAAVARLPLAFQPVRHGYLAHAQGLQLYLDSSHAVIALSRGTGRTRAVLKTRFEGAARSRPVAESRLPGVLNEFRGAKRNWRTNVPAFAHVRYRGLYPG